MPRTKEISDLRTVDLQKAGTGYKSISKSLDVHHSSRSDKWSINGERLSCLEITDNTMRGEKKPSTPTSKPHPNCKV